MNVAHPPELRQYLDKLQEALGLTHYEIIIMADEPAKSDALAAIVTTHGRRLASLYLCYDFYIKEPAEQRHVLVHELLHILEDDVYGAAFDGGLVELLGKPAYTLHESRTRLALEHLTDALATMLAPHYALPEFPEGHPSTFEPRVVDDLGGPG